MKIVIIGNGKVGSNLSSALVREGHDITVVDNEETHLRKSQNMLDVMCIEGNGATSETQLEAGVNKAGLLIAATPYDELNILCCLIGKRLGAKKTISRVRMPEYYRQMHLIREDLGLSMVINPEFATADEIMRVLVFPSAAKVEVFGKGKLELVEYRLPQFQWLDGLSFQELYKKVKTKFLICAVQREDEVFIPGGDFTLCPGDRIHVAASHKNIERFFRASGFMKNKVKTVMIVGGGSVCYYLSKQLLNMGMKVKIVEKDRQRSMKLAELLPKAIVICGDGTDQDLLVEEGVLDVDAFVALTGIDEENIIISLFAKDSTNAKVVTKINRDNYVALASELGLDCVISPKYLTTSNVVSYVRSLANAAGSEIESLYHLVGNQVEAIEFRVKDRIPGLVGIPLHAMQLKKNILICAIIRKREIVIPDGNAVIEMGDSVVIVSKEHRISSLKDILN
ncbi:Trk system potassium transporter TrkA [Ruminococcus sp.]|uniref:Trk system potassium transporter TrkA n=1 Tax=Ruminococcus sp. TaxID=41978 RepID=UPI0025E6297C|nr:Trk system potassium transporter TrkA [Ruminococcus sp.]